MINGKKHTPSSGTLKKMKAAAAAKAQAKPKVSSKPASKVSAPTKKAPMPATMSDAVRNSRANPNAPKAAIAAASAPAKPAKPVMNGKAGANQKWADDTAGYAKKAGKMGGSF